MSRTTSASAVEPAVAVVTGAGFVLAGYAASGFAALSLQVVWARALVFFAGSTTYAFTGMLVVFLLGLALGSAVASPVVERVRRPAVVFTIVQSFIWLSAAWSLLVLREAAPAIDAHWPPDASWWSLVWSSFAKAVATMAVPTVLMGAGFPLAVRLIRARSAGKTGHQATETQSRQSSLAGHRIDEDGATSVPDAAGPIVGRLYACNTAGAIVGAALTGLALLPLLGVGGTLVAAACVSVCAGLVAAWSDPAARQVALATSVVALSGIVAGIGDRTLHTPVGSERLVFYEEGPTATISVLEEVTGTRTIYIDRVPVAGTDAIMLTDQKSLAHVPMLLHPGAKRVLTVGFGSGGASWSFTRYDSLERVDAVEIDPSVFHAAPHLTASNHEVWRDRRFNLILEDARNYLASTDTRYDVIATDCTDLRYRSNANLYTVDYFRLVRERLNPGGLVTVWMPLGGLGGDTFRMALRTFRAVFPHATIWYMTNQPTHYLLLVGAGRPIEPDVEAVARGIAAPSVRSDLAEIRLDDPLKVLASRLLDERSTAALAGEGALNTDRRPLLEFQAPRLAYRDALATNLRATLAARRDDTDVSASATGGALASYRAATPSLVEGHARYQLGTFDYAGALRMYRAAAAISPADRSIPLLVADVERTRDVWLREFAERTRAGSSDSRDWMGYASLLRQVNRTPEALAANRRAAELGPRMVEPWIRLAATQAALGDRQGAVETLERARLAGPRDPVLLSDLGAAYNESGRYSEAMSVLEESLGVSPTADAHNNLGVTMNAVGKPDEARRQFERALTLNAALPDAWFNLGVTHAIRREWDSARAAYVRGLALAPDEPRALQNLATIEANAGRWGQAVDRLRAAVAQRPESAELRNELARVYMAIGAHAEAVRELEHALALDPGSPEIAENLRLARQPSGPAGKAATR